MKQRMYVLSNQNSHSYIYVVRVTSTMGETLGMRPHPPHVSFLLLPRERSLRALPVLLQEVGRHHSAVLIHLPTGLAADHGRDGAVVVPKHRVQHPEVGHLHSCPPIRQLNVRLIFQFDVCASGVTGQTVSHCIFRLVLAAMALQ